MSTTTGPETLMEPEGVLSLMKRAGLKVSEAHPEYLRHKPGESAVVGCSFTTTGGRRTRGYIRWYADPARSAVALAKSLSLRPRPGTLRVGTIALDGNTILHEFPNDDRLRHLRWYSDPRKLKRVLVPGEGVVPPGGCLSGSRTRVEVLRYNPERRVVVRIDPATAAAELPPVLLRYSTSPEAVAMNRLSARLIARGVPTPEPLTVTGEGRVGITRFVPGIEWRNLPPEAGTPTGPVAGALEALHSVPAGPDTVRRRPGDDLTRIEEGLDHLDRSLPGVSGLVGELRRVLRSRIPSDPENPHMVHGDFHGGNILVDGDAVHLIDLERVAAGSPLLDLGWLTGFAATDDARERARAVTEAYLTRCRRTGGNHADLAWYTATAMVERALRIVRRRRTDRLRSAPQALESALAELR